MISRHLELDLDDAAAGMILSEAVLDPQGNVLLPLATALTDDMLRSLRRRGIDTLMVVNNNISEADLAAERTRLQLRLNRLFRDCGEHHANKLLLQHISEYRLGHPQ